MSSSGSLGPAEDEQVLCHPPPLTWERKGQGTQEGAPAASLHCGGEPEQARDPRPGTRDPRSQQKNQDVARCLIPSLPMAQADLSLRIQLFPNEGGGGGGLLPAEL